MGNLDSNVLRTTSGAHASDDVRVRLGISRCLLGDLVRFDGGHRRDSFLTETVGRLVDWVPVCPEVELGLGTPREAVRLVGSSERPRLVGSRSGIDHTEEMQSWSDRRVADLREARIDGFIVKKGSPTCGLQRVRLYESPVRPNPVGIGLFTSTLIRAYPHLPVEDEGRLHDPHLREHFFERVFAHQRWMRLIAASPKMRDLIEFHAAHKYALLAHDPTRYRMLGALIGNEQAVPLVELIERYAEGYFAAYTVPSSKGKHVNVLEHLLGYLKTTIDTADRSELIESIDDFRASRVPLIVPVTLLRHHLRRGGVHPWAQNQVYLNPYPKELMLRNHV